jgi:hypothetical protein
MDELILEAIQRFGVQPNRQPKKAGQIEKETDERRTRERPTSNVD